MSNCEIKERTIRLVMVNLFLWTAAVPDFRTKRIPAWIPAVFMATALVTDLFVPTCVNRQELWAGAIPGALLLILSFKDREKIGEGDGLCLLICGLFTGMKQAVWIAEAALFLAAVTGAVCIMTKRLHTQDRIPFIPFLSTASSLLLLHIIASAAILP